MTKKKKTTGKGQLKKLKLKRETLKDLSVKKAGKNVRGGLAIDGGTGPETCCPCRSTSRFSDPKVIC